MIKVLSVLAEETLIDRWNVDDGGSAHVKADRIWSAGSVRAWSRLLKDLIFAHLQLYRGSAQEELSRVLYRPIREEDFEVLREFIRKMFDHAVWETPNPSESAAFTANDDRTAYDLLARHGLTGTWIQQSSQPLN